MPDLTCEPLASGAGNSQEQGLLRVLGSPSSPADGFCSLRKLPGCNGLPKGLGKGEPEAAPLRGRCYTPPPNRPQRSPPFPET